MLLSTSNHTISFSRMLRNHVV